MDGAFKVALMVKNPLANAGDIRSLASLYPRDLWVRKIPGAACGNPLQHSYMEDLMNRGAWWATARGVAKSWTLLNLLSTHVL